MFKQIEVKFLLFINILNLAIDFIVTTSHASGRLNLANQRLFYDSNVNIKVVLLIVKPKHEKKRQKVEKNVIKNTFIENY